MKLKLLNSSLASMFAIAVLALMPSPLAAGSKFKLLHNFTAGKDGSGPLLFVALSQDAKGNLYGPMAGGSNTQKCQEFGCGSVFEMKRSADGKWSESVVFKIADPQTQGSIDSVVTFDNRGNLYGCTYGGPMYELTSSQNHWTYNSIWSLGCTDAMGLILDDSGNVYGGFGNNSSGGVSELSPGSTGWTYSNLYEFCQQKGCPDGEDPLAPLTWDAKGNLHGTTYFGGPPYPGCACGVAFQMTPDGDGTWTYHVLHRFGAFHNDGQYPYGSLTVDAAGNVYGTTTHGGPHSNGTVFKLVQTGGHWKESLVFGFPGNTGFAPGGNLVFDKSRNLYGAASGPNICGGGYACGLVFKLTLQQNGRWKYTVLHNFNGTDGDYPNGLTMDSKGNLYGTTTGGGKYGYGEVFEITP